MRYDDDDDLDDLRRYADDDDEDDSDEDEDEFRRLDDDEDEDDEDESLNSSLNRSNTSRPGSGLPGPGSMRPGTGSQSPNTRYTSGGTSSPGGFQRPGSSSTPPPKPSDPFGSSRSPSPFTKPSTGPLPSSGTKPGSSPLSPSSPSPTYGSSGSSGGTFGRPPQGGQGSSGTPPVSRPPFGSSPSSQGSFGSRDSGPQRTGSDRSDTGPLRSGGGGDRPSDTGPLRTGASTSPFGKPSFGSQSTSDDKRDAFKKDEPSSSSSSAPKKDDKPAEPKKDDKPASTGGGFMSRVGSFASTAASSLPIGKKPDAAADGKPTAPGDKKDAPAPSSSSGFMSRVGNLASTAASTLPIGKKPDAAADNKPAAPGDKKDAPAPSSSGGFMSRVGNLASTAASSLPIGKKPDAPTDGKPAAPGDKKDAPVSGGGIGNFRDRMSGLASNLPFGKKDAPPADEKKDATPAKPGLPGSSSALPTGSSSSTSPFSSSSSSTASSAPKPSPFGSGSSTPSSSSSSLSSPSSSSSSPYSASSAPAKPFGSSSSFPDKRASSEVKPAAPASSAPAASTPAATGPRFGSLGGAKKEDPPAASGKKEAAAATAAPTQRQSPLGMIRGVLGRNPAPATDPNAGKPPAKGDAKSTAKGGKAAAASTGQTASPVSAIMGRFRRVLGVTEAPATKSRGSRVPQTKSMSAEEGGLTLDNYLDMAGIGLTVGSLVLFFSAMSPEKALIGNLHRLIGQLFGWGALVVPIVMFVIGMWLIVRHFGDEPPVVDPIRVTGFALGFIALLLIFQYIDSFSYREVVPNDTLFFDLLKKRIEYSWQTRQDGGGWVGASLYLFLLTNVGEIGGVFIVIFVIIVSVMLITRRTASEMAVVSISMWRSNRDRLQQRAIARRVQQQMAAARAAELAAQQPQIRIETPMPQALPAGAQAALPAPAPAIRFGRGALPESVPVQQVSQTALPGGPIPYPTPPVKDDGGGLFGRLRRGSRDTGSSAPAVAEGGRGWFSRGNTPPVVPTLPINPLPHDDETSLPPAPMPAVSMSRQPEITRPLSSGPAELLSSPPPLSMPAMPTAPAAPAPAPHISSFEETMARVQPATTPTSSADAVDPEQQARLDRMNAIRSGQLRPVPAAPEDVLTPASQLPSAQGKPSTPMQESLSVPVVSERKSTRNRVPWRLPDEKTLLTAGSDQEIDRAKLLKQAKMIEDTLLAFDAPGRVVEVNPGPVITQFGVEPGALARSGKQQKVKVGAIAALDKDLQLALGARSIRVEAPVPGKGYVGIEVPNDEPALVSLRDVMDSPGFAKHKTPLAIALGQSVSGTPISADLASMPHVLIAGTTGSGKSVCVNAIIASILVRHTPEEVRFIMVDPKRVELTGYNGIPHLVAPVVVELERIVGVLKWVTREMDERYRKFAEAGARNIEDFNKHIDPIITDKMPYIVVIIDELADLMMLAPEETERTITRIAALARATGIHLVLATQRPSVDVVTGLIKANFPARIAFAVAGSVDSRVILDQPGAERLLGRGDMLYLSGDSPAPLRLQGVYVSDMEIQNVVRFWKMQAVENPDVTRPAVIFSSTGPSPIPEGGMTRTNAKQSGMWTEQGKHPTSAPSAPSRYGDPFDDDFDEPDDDDGGDEGGDVDDDLYERAVDMVRRLEKASVSMLQRKLRIGYTRAARLIDVMEERGVVGKAKDGSSKPRDVLPPK